MNQLFSNSWFFDINKITPGKQLLSRGGVGERFLWKEGFSVSVVPCRADGPYRWVTAVLNNPDRIGTVKPRCVPLIIGHDAELVFVQFFERQIELLTVDVDATPTSLQAIM